jgi:putative oxidoreductase
MKNFLLKTLAIDNQWAITVGLTIIRVGMGLLFITHGWKKVIGGYETWLWMGQQMQYLGIFFFPLFWGICAMLSEFVGGIMLTFGICTRYVVLFMAFTMFVAVVMHIKKGDSWGVISFPLSQMIIFIGLFFAGSGPYSVDVRLLDRLSSLQ